MSGALIYNYQNRVLSATIKNISEGGMFIHQTKFFAENEEMAFLLTVPSFPFLKDSSNEKLKQLAFKKLSSHTIRFKAKTVRRIDTSAIPCGELRASFGIEVTEIAEQDKLIIRDYVEVFSSNLIYLQVLIDSLDFDQNLLSKIRFIAKILGFQHEEKISILRKSVLKAYKSLKWP